METRKWLLEALDLAAGQKGNCAPNPAVGALVVRDGRVLARGTHKGPGLPHAEPDALREPGDWARGATMVVTLEPCCHWGKTPPCTDLLISRGISRVVYAYEDPNPVVRGKGTEALRAAGVEVLHAPIPEIDAFYESYAHWTRTGLPRVTAKLALSMDGKIATEQGAPVKLTGAAADTRTHRCRRDADAILTTVATVLADNPRLDARCENETRKKKLYVIDSRLRLPRGMRVFETTESIVVFCAERMDENEMKLGEMMSLGTEVIVVPAGERGVSLRRVLEHIGRRGAHDLWVEAGGTLFQSLLAERLVDRAMLYLTPHWLGSRARCAFDDRMESLLASASAVRWMACEPDALCELEWR